MKSGGCWGGKVFCLRNTIKIGATQGVKAIEQQRKIDYSNPEPAYNNLERCREILRGGIHARKLNFSNSREQDVIIKLSNDGQSLTITKQKPGFWHKISGASVRKISFSRVKSIVYGANTSTFMQHKFRMLMSNECLRDEEYEDNHLEDESHHLIKYTTLDKLQKKEFKETQIEDKSLF